MNPIAFLLLFLVPTIGANRRILLEICSFDEATDGTFSVPFAGCALSTPLLIKNQKTIILNGGTPRHELQAAPGARHAIVTDGTFKISNLKLINGKGGCPNKNEDCYGGSIIASTTKSIVEIESILFYQNQAIGGGAVAALSGATMTISLDSRFEGNKATDGDGGAVFVSNTDTVFVFTLDIASQDITENSGVKVTQGSATGTLKTALAGATTSIVIETTAGVTFDTTTDVVIGSTTVVLANINTALNTNGTTVTLKDTTTFVGNQALLGRGGALFARDGATIALNGGNVKFTANQANKLTPKNGDSWYALRSQVIFDVCKPNTYGTLGNIVTAFKPGDEWQYQYGSDTGRRRLQQTSVAVDTQCNQYKQELSDLKSKLALCENQQSVDDNNNVLAVANNVRQLQHTDHRRFTWATTVILTRMPSVSAVVESEPSFKMDFAGDTVAMTDNYVITCQKSTSYIHANGNSYTSVSGYYKKGVNARTAKIFKKDLITQQFNLVKTYNNDKISDYDDFCSSVAITDSAVVIGTKYENVVYVFERDLATDTWPDKHTFVFDMHKKYQSFGMHLSITENWLAVTGKEEVFIFGKSAGLGKWNPNAVEHIRPSCEDWTTPNYDKGHACWADNIKEYCATTDTCLEIRTCKTLCPGLTYQEYWSHTCEKQSLSGADESYSCYNKKENQKYSKFGIQQSISKTGLVVSTDNRKALFYSVVDGVWNVTHPQVLTFPEETVYCKDIGYFHEYQFGQVVSTSPNGQYLITSDPLAEYPGDPSYNYNRYKGGCIFVYERDTESNTWIWSAELAPGLGVPMFKKHMESFGQNIAVSNNGMVVGTTCNGNTPASTSDISESGTRDSENMGSFVFNKNSTGHYGKIPFATLFDGQDSESLFTFGYDAAACNGCGEAKNKKSTRKPKHVAISPSGENIGITSYLGVTFRIYQAKMKYSYVNQDFEGCLHSCDESTTNIKMTTEKSFALRKENDALEYCTQLKDIDSVDRPCTFSSKISGQHAVPDSGCQLTQTIQVQGTMHIFGNQLDDAVVPTLTASGAGRHLSVQSGNQLYLSHLKLVGGIIHHQTGSFNCGGSVLASGTKTMLHLNDTWFHDNSSPNGGAVCVFDGASAVILASTFTANKATLKDGGALFICDENTNVTVSRGTRFKSNTALVSGGAIIVQDHAQLILAGGENTFEKNKAKTAKSIMRHDGRGKGNGATKVIFDTCRAGTFDFSKHGAGQGTSLNVWPSKDKGHSIWNNERVATFESHPTERPFKHMNTHSMDISENFAIVGGKTLQFFKQNFMSLTTKVNTELISQQWSHRVWIFARDLKDGNWDTQQPLEIPVPKQLYGRYGYTNLYQNNFMDNNYGRYGYTDYGTNINYQGINKDYKIFSMLDTDFVPFEWCKTYEYFWYYPARTKFGTSVAHEKDSIIIGDWSYQKVFFYGKFPNGEWNLVPIKVIDKRVIDDAYRTKDQIQISCISVGPGGGNGYGFTEKDQKRCECGPGGARKHFTYYEQYGAEIKIAGGQVMISSSLGLPNKIERPFVDGLTSEQDYVIPPLHYNDIEMYELDEAAPHYIKLTSTEKNCEDGGYSTIHTREECQSAATYLNLPDQKIKKNHYEWIITTAVHFFYVVERSVCSSVGTGCWDGNIHPNGTIVTQQAYQNYKSIDTKKECDMYSGGVWREQENVCEVHCVLKDSIDIEGPSHQGYKERTFKLMCPSNVFLLSQENFQKRTGKAVYKIDTYKLNFEEQLSDGLKHDTYLYIKKAELKSIQDNRPRGCNFYDNSNEVDVASALHINPDYDKEYDNELIHSIRTKCTKETYCICSNHENVWKKKKSLRWEGYGYGDDGIGYGAGGLHKNQGFGGAMAMNEKYAIVATPTYGLWRDSKNTQKPGLIHFYDFNKTTNEWGRELPNSQKDKITSTVVSGRSYTIVSVGTFAKEEWVQIGAPSDFGVGTQFTATCNYDSGCYVNGWTWPYPILPLSGGATVKQQEYGYDTKTFRVPGVVSVAITSDWAVAGIPDDSISPYKKSRVVLYHRDSNNLWNEHTKNAQPVFFHVSPYTIPKRGQYTDQSGINGLYSKYFKFGMSLAMAETSEKTMLVIGSSVTHVATLYERPKKSGASFGRPMENSQGGEGGDAILLAPEDSYSINSIVIADNGNNPLYKGTKICEDVLCSKGSKAITDNDCSRCQIPYVAASPTAIMASTNWGKKGLRIFQPASLYSMINNDFSGCPQACPAGKTTTGGPSSHLVRALTDPDKWCTESCPVGHFCTIWGPDGKEIGNGGSGTFPCPPGKYNDQRGKTSEESCKECVAAKFSGFGFETCQDCPAGKSSVAGSPDCRSCTAGTILKTLVPLKCEFCKAGLFQPKAHLDNTITCSDCEIGKMTPKNGGTYQINGIPFNDYDKCITCQLGTGGYIDDKTACPTCKQSTYQNTEEATKPSSCTACPIGQYTVDDGNDRFLHLSLASCLKCDIGTEYNEIASKCVVCTAGKYNNEEGKHCKLCPIGRYINITNPRIYVKLKKKSQWKPYEHLPGTILDKNLLPSEHDEMTDCSTCPIAYEWRSSVEPLNDAAHLLAASTPCSICSAGRYMDESGDTIINNKNVDGIQSSWWNEITNTIDSPASCKYCPGGFENPDKGAEVRMHDGKINFNGLHDCGKCPAGKVSDKSRAFCDTCAIGRVQTGNDDKPCEDCEAGRMGKLLKEDQVCLDCPVGWYQGRAATAYCLPCLPGTTANETKATVCEECTIGKVASKPNSIDCVACAEGKTTYTLGGTVCLSCESGYYMSKITQPHSCQECAMGKTSEYDSAVCSPCEKGKYLDQTMTHLADELKKGTITEAESKKSSCKSCPEGRLNTELGKKSIDGCLYCLVGTFFKSAVEACGNCEQGKYQNENDVLRASCLSCPKGRYRTTISAKKIEDCQYCKAGSFFISSTEVCGTCGAGKYQDENNAAPAACKLCKKGTYSNEVGLTDSEQCSKCNSGTYSSVMGVTTSSGCNDCPPGRYSKISGVIGRDGCLECPRGKVAEKGGLDRCTSCSGQSPSESKTTCIDCPAGTWKDTEKGNEDTSECIKCKEGMYRNLEKNATGETMPTCKACPAGYYQSREGSASCYPCVPGQFNPAKKQSSCKQCGINDFTSEINETACKRCPLGEGTNNKTGSTTCIPCIPGEASIGAGGTCAKCPQGSKRGEEDASATCVECELGKATSSIGSTVCSGCNLGRYGAIMGGCTDCPGGWYQDALGSSTCKACPINTYRIEAKATGLGDCSSCANKYAPFTGTGTATNVSDPTLGCKCAGARPEAGSSEKNGFYAIEEPEFSIQLLIEPASDRSICRTCPNGALCLEQGMKLKDIYGKPGFWRRNITTKIFTDCSTAYSGTNNKELAQERCCPIVNNVSICKLFVHNLREKQQARRLNNESESVLEDYNADKQCFQDKISKNKNQRASDLPQAYGGTLCKTCLDSNYIKNGDTCTLCEGGSSLMNTIGATVLFLFLLFLLFMLLFCRAGKPKKEKDDKKGKKGKKGKKNQGKKKKKVIQKKEDTLEDKITKGRSNDAASKFVSEQMLIGRVEGKREPVKTAPKQMSANEVGFRSDTQVLYDRIKVVYSWLQIFTSLTFTFDIPWPTNFKRFNLNLGVVNLNLGDLFGATQCSLSIPFLSKFALHMVLPFLIVFTILLARIPAYCKYKKKIKEHVDRQKAQKALMIKLITTFLLILYPGLCVRIFTTLKCTNVDGFSVLSVDYGIACYQKEHMKYVLLSFICIGVWVLGIPLWILISLYRNKKHLFNRKSDKHEEIVNEYGTLYLQYEPKYWYWEIIVIFKKMVLTGVMVIVASGSSLQLVIALVVVLINLLLVLKVAPFADYTDDWLSFLTSFQMLLTLLGGLLLFTDNPSNPSYDSANMGLGLMVINSFAFVALFVSILMLTPCCRKKINKLGGDGGNSTKVLPRDGDGLKFADWDLSGEDQDDKNEDLQQEVEIVSEQIPLPPPVKKHKVVIQL